MTKRTITLLLLLAAWLFILIGEEHRLMELRLQIPKKEKELAALDEERARLEMEIDTSLNPKKLLELLREPAYSHLGFPQKDL